MNNKLNIKKLLFLYTIVVFGGVLRGIELRKTFDIPLKNDAAGYKMYAERMDFFSKENGFYSGNFGIREPFFILLGKLFLTLFGNKDSSMRILSFFFSLLLIPLVYFVASSWFNERVGLLSALFCAFYPNFISSSVEALREEVYVFFFFLYLYFAYVKVFTPLKRGIVLGIFGGILLLVRTESIWLIFIILSSLFIFRRKQWGIPSFALSLSLSFCLFAPHLLGLWRVHGDPFYPGKMHIRSYANSEFRGTPGFPEEKIRENVYYGGPLSAKDYLKLHTPCQLITYPLLGYFRIYGGSLLYSVLATDKANIGITSKIKGFLSGSITFFEVIRPLRRLSSKYPITIPVGVLFLLGLILKIKTLFSEKILFFLLILLPLPLSFLAWVDAPPRYWIHLYPLLAFLSAKGINERFGSD